MSSSKYATLNVSEFSDTRKKSTGLLKLLFKLGLFSVFLQSLYVWFTWEIEPHIVPALSTCFCLLYLMGAQHSSFTFLSIKNVVAVALLIIAKFYSVGNGFLGTLLSILPVVLVIFLSPKDKLELLDFFTNSMAVILFLSLLVWVLLLAKISLPSLGIVSNPAWDAYVYENYFFCLRNIPLYTNRFTSIFLEPGHLGMILSLLLFVNKFDIKRRAIWIILIAVFFTFSLAAYILTFLSFFIYLVLFSRKSLTYFAISVVLIASGYIFFTNWNDGKNIVNEKILSRLEYDKSKGIAGNNRVQKSLDNYYARFINKDEAWLGIGLARYEAQNFGAGNAGYKVFLIQNGIVGMSLIFLFYLYLALANKSKFSIMLLIVYVIAFLQRAYPFWACELLIFITATPLHNLIWIKGEQVKFLQPASRKE
jgi:hypothetical protein